MPHGFVQKRNGKIITFDPKGSVITDPYFINKKGVIAGSYQKENPGPVHGFVRTP
jgi:hypothetical protein